MTAPLQLRNIVKHLAQMIIDFKRTIVRNRDQGLSGHLFFFFGLLEPIQTVEDEQHTHKRGAFHSVNQLVKLCSVDQLNGERDNSLSIE